MTENSGLYGRETKVKGYLLYEEGKHDERNKECASQNSDTGKIFLGIGIVGGELGACRRYASHDRCRLGCPFVFLSHFISPSIVICEAIYEIVQAERFAAFTMTSSVL
jgi:hypothetical protein